MAADSATASQGAKRTALALVVTALSVPQVMSSFYLGLGLEMPHAVLLLSGLALWFSIAAWFSFYSREHHVRWVLDMEWFLLAWVVVVPYYILKREGRHGVGRIAMFASMWFATWAVSWAVLIWVQVFKASE